MGNKRAIVLLIALVAGIPSFAFGQTRGYVVTATLDPYFINPYTGEDVTAGRPLAPLYGLKRGADGALYAMTGTSSGGMFAILRVSPTTGEASVLYVLEDSEPSEPGSRFYRGYDGRFYFTAVDYPDLRYAAPWHFAGLGCSRGCVLLLDTTLHGENLRLFFDFAAGDEGQYPRNGIEAEDTSGAIYVYSTEGYEECSYSGSLVKISPDGSGEVVQCLAYDPPFDWSQVTGSGNEPWRFSDGQKYFASSDGIYQHDGSSAPVRISTISASDGVPVGELTEAGGYLYGITRWGGALDGGVVFRIRLPSLASPDLVITSVSPPPTVAGPGESFSVTDTAHNGGPEPAATSVTSYYLSLTGDKADVKLLGSRYLPELAAGEDSTGPRTVKVPSTAPVGTYWLIACADATGNVAEGDESNNCFSASTQVTVGRPDLRESAVSTAASFAPPGSKVTVSDTVDNPSAVTATASTTRYYLSLDSAKGAGDVLLTGKRAVSELPPGAVSAGSTSVTIPLSTPAGTYYVLACADDLLKIKEASEANNCAASAGAMRIGWPDLVTTAVSNPPTDAALGGKFTTTDTVLNQGNVLAGASKTRYYLSLDTVRSAGDVLLTGTRSVVSLAAGATSTGSKAVTVPLSAAPGTYYILACADDLLKVGESDEANNCRASAATTDIIRP